MPIYKASLDGADLTKLSMLTNHVTARRVCFDGSVTTIFEMCESISMKLCLESLLCVRLTGVLRTVSEVFCSYRTGRLHISYRMEHAKCTSPEAMLISVSPGTYCSYKLGTV